MKSKRHDDIARKLLTFLSRKKKSISPLLIITHDFPDPDALASAYALQYLADHSFHIRSRIVYRGVIGRVENRNMVDILDLPVHRLNRGELQKYSHFALIDTQPDFENNPFPEDGKTTLTIDQHSPLSRPLSDCAIIDTGCGATSIILSKALLLLKINIPERLATALAYGIITDTLNLYRARRPDILTTYLHILSLSNMPVLAHIQTPEQEKSFFTGLSRAITQAKMCKGLIASHLGRVSNPDTVSQTADFLLSYKEAAWTLVTGRFHNNLHISLRAKKKEHNAGKILRKCLENPEDAGGHDQIAGGSLRVRQPNERKWKQEEKQLQKNLVTLLGFGKCNNFFRPFKSDKR